MSGCEHRAALALVQAEGLASAWAKFVLLPIGTVAPLGGLAPSFGAAFKARDAVLIIADPNVRVQTVIDGQSIAQNDSLVNPEIERGRIFRLSDHRVHGTAIFSRMSCLPCPIQMLRHLLNGYYP